MFTQKKLLLLTTLAAAASALNGCGSGTQIVKNLDFKAGQENGHLVAGFDAKITLGQGSLPDAKLPIYNPKSPAEFLGYIETNPDGTLTVRVDVTTAAKVQVTDGTLLPNGREIPVVLPAGVTPIAIPVINSNSKVYLAVGSQNIMAGVAVTLLADAGSSSTDWIRILQSLPANLFYPFQLGADLKGTAGVFTGDKVGVGVFAIKTLGGSTIAPKVSFASFGGEADVNSLAAVNGNKPLSSEPEVFGVKTQYPTGSKMNRIQRELRKVRHTKLD